MVERIDEVGPELQFESLSEGEVFVHAQVDIGVMRPAKTTELGSAGTERPRNGFVKLPSLVNH